MSLTRPMFATKYKKDDALLPGLVTAGSKLLSIYNQELNVFQHLNSIVLLKGGCKKSAFARLSATYDCLSYPAALNLSDKYGSDWDKQLNVWKEANEQDAATENILQQQVSDIENEIRILNDTEDHGGFILARQQAIFDLEMHRQTMHPGYYFVGDNVDMRTKVRHMTFAHQNKDQHMYQICAYENRVSGNHLDNTRPKAQAEEVPFVELVPCDAEKEKLTSDFAFLVASKWAQHIPCFQKYKAVLPSHIQHQYLDEMKQKSRRVIIAISPFSPHLFTISYIEIQL